MARSSTPAAPDLDFVDRWNQLPTARRKQIRRLVRAGRMQVTADDARLAVGYVAHQRSQTWCRWFWVWYPVATIATLFAAGFTHPLVVGLVFGVAANLLLVLRGYRKVETVNAAHLGGRAPATVTQTLKSIKVSRRTTAAKPKGKARSKAKAEAAA
jgi:hypothetical protein